MTERGLPDPKWYDRATTGLQLFSCYACQPRARTPEVLVERATTLTQFSEDGLFKEADLRPGVHQKT